MPQYRRLLVGLSCTLHDPLVIRYASMLARLGPAEEASFLHVLPDEPADRDGDAEEAALEAIQTAVRENFDAPAATECRVLPPPLVDRLLSAAAENATDLIVVGHQTGHRGRNSLARRLAMNAPCSVWLVPENSQPEMGRILVPVDFSNHAADALGVATRLAQEAGLGECLALHVAHSDPPLTFYEEGSPLRRGEEEQAFRDFVASAECREINVVPLFEEGTNPAHIIHRTALERSADLIVMATRGRSRSAAILLGSVTEDVIVQTHVPLLVVKNFGAQLGLLRVLLDKSFLRRDA